jgi:hypothetical protein
MASQFGGILVSAPSGGSSQFGGKPVEGGTLEPIGYRDGMPVYSIDVYPRPAEPVFQGPDPQGKPVFGIPPAPAKPPLPAGLGGEPEHIARNIDPRTGEYIQTPAIGTVPLLDAPFTGTVGMIGGVERIQHAPTSRGFEPWLREVAGGGSEMIRGGLEAATPLLPGAFAGAPLATAITLGTGMGLTHGTETTLNALGVPKEYSALGSDLIGLFGAGWAHAKLRGLANLPYLREGNEIQMRLQEAVRRAQDPQATPMDRAAAKAQADALMQRLQEVEGRQPGGSAYVPPGSQAYAAAQEVKEQGRKYGVRLSAGDISQKPTLKNIEVSAEKIPGIGMEGFREKQQIEAKAAAGNVRSQYEDALINAEPSALDDLRAAAEKGDERARNVLEKMTQAGNDPDRVIQASIGLGDWTTRQKATELYDKVQDLAEKHNLGDVPLNTTGKAIGSSLQQLRPAKLPNKEVIRLLQEVKDSISPKLDSEGNPLLDAEGKPVSPNNTYALIRQLHSDLGERIREYYQGNNALIGEKGVGYLERVNNALEDDMRNYAQNSGVPEIVEAGKIADEYYKSARVPYKNGMLAAAATSNEPDQIFQQFIKAGKKDRAQNFYSALDDRGKAAVRYNMVAKAVDDSINPQSGIFSPQKFFTAVDKLDDAYGVFFTAKDKAEIQGFKNLMGHVTRAGQYAENPPTGQRVIPYLVAGGAASAIPAAIKHPFMAGTGLAVIAAARGLLTTVKGRDLLLRMNGIKQGSPLMESLWQRIGKEMLQFTRKPPEEPPKSPFEEGPPTGGGPSSAPPLARGYTRMYHGGVEAPIDGPRWFTSDLRYAQGYANKAGGVVHYVDIPTDHPLVEPGWPDQSIAQGFHQNVELPAEIATQAKVMPSPAGGGGIGSRIKEGLKRIYEEEEGSVKAPTRFPVLPKTVEQYMNEPSSLWEDIGNLLTDKHGISVGLRGIWSEELNKIPRRSTLEGYNERLPGTSAIDLIGDRIYDYPEPEKIKFALGKVSKYGGTDYIAVLVGDPASRDVMTMDPGEAVIVKPKVVAYIKRK